MADIKSYTKEKEKRERGKGIISGKFRLVKSENEETFREKLHRHKLTSFYRVLLALAVCAAIIVLAVLQYKNKTYTDYDVITSAGIAAAGGTTDLVLGKHVLTYSKDGARCTDAGGNVLWNQTYEMQSPIVSICGNVAAIGDYNGRTIYVLDEEKQLGTITTNLPIRNLCVAANGVTAAVLEDTNITWIYIYDTAGNVLLYFRTSMKDTGYPMAVSLSDNALLCAVSYLYVDAGTVKSTVAFYNFDEYGKNQIDNLVGFYDYVDTIVPYVQFLDNNHIFVVGDDCLAFYKGSQVPELQSTYYFNQEVRGIYHNESYVGIVFYNATGNGRFRLEIFGKNGQRVRTQEFDMDYTNILFDGDTYIIYNQEECMVMTMDGTEKYSGAFKKAVRLLIPHRSSYRYVLVTQDSIDTIQLK